MLPINKLLDKIRWDSREDVADYTIGYKDRFKEELVFIPLTSVVRDGSYLRAKDGKGKEIVIPTHRIRQVVKKGMVVWERGAAA
jgi:uncharacterized protein (UPF0248 family)